MVDPENSVRELLHTAVPDLEADPYDLINGAAAYARRNRMARAVGAAVAVVIVAALLATGWVGVQRARPVPATPAPNPMTQELCQDLRPTGPPGRPASNLSGESAAICPTGSAGGPGWDLPGAPLTMERWVDYLRAGVAATPSTACSPGPAGPPFVLSVKRIAGDKVSYRSSDLACGGREVVARYLAALAYQQADRDAAVTSGHALHCSPPKPNEPNPLMTPLATLHSAHSPGLLCAYPVFDPSSPDPLLSRDYQAVHLTAHALAVINADLAKGAFSTHAPVECAPTRRELTLRLATPGSHSPAGEQVEFVGTCLAVLRLSGNALWWRPNASTRATLAALLPAD